MRTDGQTGGQTNLAKLMVAFRNFANASEKYKMVTPTQVLQFHSLTEEYEGSFNDESRTAKVVSL
jgi:hypothetical protein